MKVKILIPLIAGLGLLCACKGKSKYEIVSNSNADSAKTDSTIETQLKLVKTAGMRFKVKDVTSITEHITALTTTLNGMVIHHQMESTANKSLDVKISNDSVMRVTSFITKADLTIKIPSAKLEFFMNQIARMGLYVNSRSMDITDKSLDYLSAQLKLKNRTELVNQQKSGKVLIKNPENVLLLKDDMTDEQISNININDAVKYSVVTLSTYQNNTIYKEIVANDDPSAYNLPFVKRFGMAIENGWAIFIDVIIGLTNMWGLIFAGLGIWIIIKIYKRKKGVILIKF